MLFSVAVLTLLFGSGCKGVQNYHPDNSVIHAPGTNFYNAFIEFDDQGELLQPSQISNAVAAIKSAGPVFLVGYVHGWKNDADPNNDNVVHFTNMLSGFARYLPDRKLKVFGVYFGWRGDPVQLNDPISWVARNLSFWSRHAAADRVAGTSATEAIYSVLQAANANTNSRVVLIGHSFGGLILEKALSQAMVSTLFSQTNTADVKPPADLVLLINEAASSIQARQFISMLGRLPARSAPPNGATNTASAFDRGHPLIISATSTGDCATGVLFPISMWFSGLTKSFRPSDTNEPFKGSQFSFYRTTPGHNHELLSHRVVTTARPQSATHTTLEQEQIMIAQNLRPRYGANRFEFQINDYAYRIQPNTNSFNQTPYWVMQVPRSIIKNHDDILNERFTGLVAALLSLSQITDPTVPERKVQREKFRQGE
jgi:hypothetical protein